METKIETHTDHEQTPKAIGAGRDRVRLECLEMAQRYCPMSSIAELVRAADELERYVRHGTGWSAAPNTVELRIVINPGQSTGTLRAMCGDRMEVSYPQRDLAGLLDVQLPRVLGELKEKYQLVGWGGPKSSVTA